jgi:DNA-binding transcriptional MerR regulator
MQQESYSLNDLATTVGLEARTIRSYIERGLLPGAETRGRAASYSNEHLSRLHVIKSLRRARNHITLSEIRIVLEGLTPEQIQELAKGSIIVADRVISGRSETVESLENGATDGSETTESIDWERTATKVTGVERLVLVLRDLSGFTASPSTSRVEGWQRIAITPDVELSVRAEFNRNQLAAFRELADLLRHMLQRPNALSNKDGE